jgi:hypothetical protein
VGPDRADIRSLLIMMGPVQAVRIVPREAVLATQPARPGNPATGRAASVATKPVSAGITSAPGPVCDTTIALASSGLLGDRVAVTSVTSVTSARLVLSLFADPAAPSTPIGVGRQIIPVDLAGEEEEGVRFIIGRVGFSCNGQSLADPVERRIARYLFFFGSGEFTVQAGLDGAGQPSWVVCRPGQLFR